MKIAYVQSIGGASGDMLLAALLDAGLPLKFLQDERSHRANRVHEFDRAEFGRTSDDFLLQCVAHADRA